MSLARLADHLEKHTGIDMGRAGLGRMLERYLDKRVPELGLPSREAYVDTLHGNDHELGRLIEVVTVPHTWFFRDIEQWRAVEILLDGAASHHPMLRLWIPGCATGEDAYTMALIARRRGFPVQITASDINPTVLARARRGLYNGWSIRDVPAEYRSFLHPHGDAHFELDEALRRSVTFVTHNLVDTPLAPREGSWDLILCRNVFIYIVRAQAEPTLRRLGLSLRAGGSLVLGASDLVYTLPPELCADYANGRLVLRRLASDPRSASLAVLGPRAPAATSDPLSAALRAASEAATMAKALNRTATPLPISARTRSSLPPRGDVHQATHLVTQANRKLDGGDSSGALSLYEQARTFDPLAPEPYFFAGVAHHGDGRFEEAVHRLRSSLFLDPAFWPASIYLALCYERLERPEDALSEYERVASAADAPFRFRAETSIGPDLLHWRRELIAFARRRAKPGT
ncbi:MAG: CheR family methyltransferase [Polyangiaceae bacterium]